MTDDPSFHVASLFGHRTQRPLVSVKLKDVAVQVTPMKAREMAMLLLEGAEAAEGDGFVVSFFQEQVGLKEAEATAMMSHFRDYRKTRQAHDERTENEGEQP